jgi:7-cyano-7-deazaguanine synthase
MIGDRALVLFSGGQDSTTCLAWALTQFGHVETVGFDYGQRHIAELAARPVLLESLREFSNWESKLGADHVLPVNTLRAIGGTALTDDMKIETGANGLPTTFVPGRNLIFLMSAAALGYRRGISNLVGGMCETDFSGYPDCRDDTIKAMQVALSLGMDRPLRIETPLMWIDKAQTWALAGRLGDERLVELIIEKTHTCYLGNRESRHVWGYGCGTCPACELRAKGFAKYRAGAAGGWRA